MDTGMTRQQLYALVWSKPRTALAKELGVSDVWIGKQCRALNVPAPPPGYWANLVAGGGRKGRYEQPPLSFTLAERIQDDHERASACQEGFNADDLQQPLPPMPVIEESVEESVARYAVLVRQQTSKSPTRSDHPAILKLKAEDDRRAALTSTYSWNEPKYRSTQGRAVLDALQRLIWFWSDLGLKVSSGGTRHITLYVSLGGRSGNYGASYSRSFEVRAREVPSTAGIGRARKAEAELLELRYEIAEHETRGKKVMPVHAFSAMDRATLERFTIDLVAHWEQRFREGVKWRHDQFASSRRWALEKAEEARRREADRLATQARALIQGRQRLLHRALDGIRRSDQIRALVLSLQASKAVMTDEQDSIDRWAVWACQQADLLDPRLMSVEQATKWVRDFRLEQE